MQFYNRIIYYLCIISSLILISLPATGCKGVDNDDSNRFYELLKQLPVPLQDPGYLQVVDYALFRKNYNVSFDTTDDNPIIGEDYLKAMNAPEGNTIGVGSTVVGAGSFITGNGRYMMKVNTFKYLGYDASNIDAEIQYIYPPYDVVSAIGHFDPAKTAKALANQDDWPSSARDAYSTVNYRDIIIHSWGDGLKPELTRILTPPHIDQLGRAKPLAISKNSLLYASSVDTIKLMIDASQNKTDSLADLQEYVLVARGLSKLETYVGIIGRGTLVTNELDEDTRGKFTDSQYQEIMKSQEPRLKRFTTFGTGLGKDEKGLYVALVLVHNSSSDAAQNVTLLKQRIETTNSIRADIPRSKIITDMDINYDGKVLVAKLYNKSTSYWASWLINRDLLLYHE